MSKDLNPTKALIFRIIHRDNMAEALREGLHCRNAVANRDGFVPIGNPDLIRKRQSRVVDCPPGGTLGDYVPFYFTPFSPMMFNIKTGFQGVQKRRSEEIVIFVSSLHHLTQLSIPFVFSDRHAYLRLARFSNDLADLHWLDWEALQARDFRRDDADRFERYQAEALVHRHVPVEALLGIVCFNEAEKTRMEGLAASAGRDVRVIVKRGWYL